MKLTDVDVLPLPTGRLELRRAWPKSPDHALLEYVGPDGLPVAAQWLRDDDHRRHVLVGTPFPAFVAPGTGVLVQPAGADRKLHNLAPLLAEPGSRLISHRAERRAVILRADGCYVKVVRQGRSHALAQAAETVGAAVKGHVDVPELMEHDPDRGVLVWSALPGTTLHQQAVASAGSAPAIGWAETWRRAGEAIGHLHATPTVGLGPRGVEQERRAAARWVAPARELGLLPEGPDLPDLPDAPGMPYEVALHGDLHDKQLVVDGHSATPRIGLLDVDQLSRGEAAIDVANLLVHIDLRAAQRLLTPAAADLARSAFLDGLEADAAMLARVGQLSDLIRMRLAGLYAFRPPWRAVARRLYASVLSPS